MCYGLILNIKLNSLKILLQDAETNKSRTKQVKKRVLKIAIPIESLAVIFAWPCHFRKKGQHFLAIAGLSGCQSVHQLWDYELINVTDKTYEIKTALLALTESFSTPISFTNLKRIECRPLYILFAKQLKYNHLDAVWGAIKREFD